MVLWLEAFFALGSLVRGTPEPSSAYHVVETDYEWLAWKREHDRVYEGDRLLELERYIIWRANGALVDAHNRYASTFGYTLELNKFADLVSSLQE